MAYPSKVNRALEAAITAGLTDSKVAHLVMRKYPKICSNHKSLSTLAWRIRKDLGIESRRIRCRGPAGWSGHRPGSGRA